MRKTCENKHQAFWQGVDDGFNGKRVPKKHPYMGHYMNGYRKGQSYKNAKKRKPGIGIRFVFWVIKKLGVD